MARESFSCKDVAAILNESFIPIKLDREERPDVDDVYMNYVEATNGSGGWPLNVFLTPDLEPVFGGTYWPSPDSASNLATVVPTREEIPMISFIEILEKLRDLWETQQWRCRESARGITQQLKEFAEEGTHSTPAKDEKKGAVIDKTEVTSRDLEIDLLEETYQNFAARFDTYHGGFGLAPKFPMPSNLSFLLRLARYPSSAPVADIVGYDECKYATQMVVETLIAMARGGLHDHLGHGFARYSITADWGLPHFEKMLSDQAQLLDVYLDAFEATRHPELLSAVFDLIGYLTSPPILSPETNAFYCSEDADSLPARPDSSSSNHSDKDDAVNHKHEGAFYTWTLREFVNILGTRDAEVCARYWGVEADGNIPRDYDPADEFLNQNVLSVRATPSSLARDFGLSEEEVVKIIKHARKRLDEHRRTRRVPPDVDDKIVAGWNGLAIHALAKASIVISAIDEDRARTCLEVAEKCMQFVRREMIDKESGQIWRVWRHGTRTRTPGFAEDYAYLTHAAIRLYYATFDDEYLQFADKLQGMYRKPFPLPFGSIVGPKKKKKPVANNSLTVYLNKHFLSYDDPIDPDKSTGYFTTPSPFPSGVPPPLLRLKQGTDSAHPAANGIIVQNLLRLSHLLNDEKYAKLAEETVTAFAAEILQHPFLFVNLLDGVVGLEIGVKGIVGVIRNKSENAKVSEEKKKTDTAQNLESQSPRAAGAEDVGRRGSQTQEYARRTPERLTESKSATAESIRSAVISEAHKAAGHSISTCTTTVALIDCSQPEKSAWLRQRNSLLQGFMNGNNTDDTGAVTHGEIFVCEEGTCKLIEVDVDMAAQMDQLHLK